MKKSGSKKKWFQRKVVPKKAVSQGERTTPPPPPLPQQQQQQHPNTTVLPVGPLPVFSCIFIHDFFWAMGFVGPFSFKVLVLVSIRAVREALLDDLGGASPFIESWDSLRSIGTTDVLFDMD